MTKVCRLCLSKLQRGSKYFNINAVESFTGFMPYRDQLTTCIPEMALDLIPNPVICNTCRTALKTSYEFKSRCLLVEKKIREYVESQGCEDEQVSYDLSKIPITDLPPLHKLNFLQKELECLEEQQIQEQMKQQQLLLQQHQQRQLQQQKQQHQQQHQQVSKNNSQLLLQLQKEVVLPNSSEIEITVGLNNKVIKRKLPQQAEIKNSSKSENDDAFECTRSDQLFLTAAQLEAHKESHNDGVFACNFCKEAFKTLQQLRRHNNICSKVMGTADVNPILTKRPHLPTKAKNHLKRWLFKHTDHPYPTDHEKQMLMQETNLSLLQVENWFINARRRILQDLTKLKNHGVRADELHEHNLSIQGDLDLDQLGLGREDTSPGANKRSLNGPPPPLVPLKRARRGRYTRRRWAPIKPDPELEDEEVDETNFNGIREAEQEEKTSTRIKIEPELRQDPLEIVSIHTVKDELNEDVDEDEEEEENEESMQEQDSDEKDIGESSDNKIDEFANSQVDNESGINGEGTGQNDER
ncbi:unnamed protein product [Callosobruchus maculatus]|uniref:Homeobox domain-containing protein n=1 Tax=Callosobruchus maculatus TaxID=64391 RepID=A0A653CSL6_CALMS|nr:unnamed protein product [Callosobruchus maculatus]